VHTSHHTDSKWPNPVSYTSRDSNAMSLFLQNVVGGFDQAPTFRGCGKGRCPTTIVHMEPCRVQTIACHLNRMLSSSFLACPPKLTWHLLRFWNCPFMCTIPFRTRFFFSSVGCGFANSPFRGGLHWPNANGVARNCCLLGERNLKSVSHMKQGSDIPHKAPNAYGGMFAFYLYKRR